MYCLVRKLYNPTGNSRIVLKQTKSFTECKDFFMINIGYLNQCVLNTKCFTQTYKDSYVVYSIECSKTGVVEEGV